MKSNQIPIVFELLLHYQKLMLDVLLAAMQLKLRRTFQFFNKGWIKNPLFEHLCYIFTPTHRKSANLYMASEYSPEKVLSGIGFSVRNPLWRIRIIILRGFIERCFQIWYGSQGFGNWVDGWQELLFGLDLDIRLLEN